MCFMLRNLFTYLDDSGRKDKVYFFSSNFQRLKCINDRNYLCSMNFDWTLFPDDVL